ncbi:cell division protein FtsQ/DivIB [Lentimicrobium sp. S6]|uniref:cell division protein FtsQ/DivIB n=1 Tax=Lentimicrobium sp. S6 TaxID=2735872 RepID=UPI001557AFFF|nr:hypothetical protein [Lentimicrobium sp. S6]NPD44317.1 hypothetical protein [Lentimicrobium sp. S6]
MIIKIINKTLWIASFLAAIVILVWANIERANSFSSDIQVKMLKTDYPSLISQESIQTHILETMPTMLGQSVRNINLSKIENEICQNAQLIDVRTFVGIDGLIHIKVKPRKASLRIFDIKGKNLYLADGLVLMDNSLDYTQRIMVASGDIPHLNKEEKLQVLKGERELPQIYKSLYELAEAIHKDAFLEALIDQIYVNKNGQVELTPKLGVKNIEFGDINDIDKKLENLKAFYVNGKDRIDWQKYKSINIKYDNQIVCSKK